MDDNLRAAALEYHAQPRPGKLAIQATKVLSNQRDLSLAYSPGVAAACDAIVADPATASLYTARANLIGVVTNGTAVLGLGPIGPLAAKPVMEGKAVLFKKFAGIDVFDIELAERDPDRLVDIIAALEPTFGGINLEDIKAPECFYIERRLRERMRIPVFHDDQHGTAIVVGAAILNGLHLVGKPLDKVKLVTSGAGAAALACLGLLEKLGIPLENIWVTDIHGVVYEGRTEDMDPLKARYAKPTQARALGEIIKDADVFLGLSAAGVLKPELLAHMAPDPLILALANPVPEILPALAREVRPDAVIATGRSDHPNQVNNVLCFPFIFRGALDVGATTINDEMQLAAVQALAALAREEQSDVVASAYGEQPVCFGREYLIPRPFDPRLIVRIAPAVAKAAMDSGVATRPIADWEAYRQQLNNFIWHSGLLMKPVFAAARTAPRRIIFAEGESERVLRAVQTAVDEGIAQPVLIGRPEVIALYIERFGLRLRPGVDFELVNQDSDPRYKELWQRYHQIMERRGVTAERARREVLRQSTLIGALMLEFGWADGMICGTTGQHAEHLQFIDNVLGRRTGVSHCYAMNLLVLPGRTVALCDTYVNYDPTAEQLYEMTCLAAEELQRFGITPHVALLSHSSFGSDETPTAAKMRQALALLHARRPDIAAEGEMHGDAALDATLRAQIFPNTRMQKPANLLVFPTLDAANIAFNLLKTACGDGMTIGPILLGTARPVHILTPTATVRRIVNMTALTVAEANHNAR
ncbi:MAG: NADP-dependent malic enzyme [Candidatus Dactylopiibacterium carminicum]|uniref:NADP-dependent malic enzyme n=1 Tax=Candidatus Dactylopiibacterium carminicum TaxID=857335 RepID=A0A272EMN1_9RHOO|nr:NADP-dependent malic enzyme [Candidatus Dactylopiibacterium carminicum]KAF7597778.1 NADP-dependent malic enzyme [Candidatus Dactylopiibacterium carminicum]PAS91371.1 MAG: NADP-dependent malic enzyme [Candidatus Dactylopiibacterium carminicum]PAS92373.1 MAG: NADP-dependent malic enzyme [Candidatus Dactylopiibacterium carminicum]PAS95487.1 MAG: NADP-dependent malic enzyme [Candidatus Dactylopiibacterium carminicum]